MEETRELLKRSFRTSNKFTFPISGTGTAGLEASISNLIEDGKEVVVGANGYFGERIADVAARCGAKVIAIRKDWGEAIAL